MFFTQADAVKILALETSGTAGSVALLEGQHIAGQEFLPEGQRTAQTLAPTIRNLLSRAKWRPGDVGLVAVAQGPGSFTGLRIGVTTAKTFAYAIDAEILGVDTLEVVATRAPASCQRLDVVLDAQRREVFATRFRRGEDGQLRPETATRIIGRQDWLQMLEAGIRVSGPALAKLAESLPAGVEPVEAELWTPTAAAVGLLALRRHEAGARRRVEAGAVVSEAKRGRGEVAQRQQSAAAEGQD